jgi:enolase
LLPLPDIQIIGGGAHANWRTDVQDFMVVAIGATSYEQALEMTHNVYRSTRDLLSERGKLFGIADEGGFWPDVRSNEETFELVHSGIERAGYVAGHDVALSLDIAASDLYDVTTQRYAFRTENRTFDRAEFIKLLLEWCAHYHVISIEDPLADSDWAGWSEFRSAAPQNLQIIGDDLFVTNLQRIRLGFATNAANAVLIKLNQIGTVSETLDAIQLTQSQGWRPVISARSGDTEDVFISHLAVATNAGQLKVGSFSRSERMAKWNEVIRIARDLGARATFRGAGIFAGASASVKGINEG